MRGVDIANDIAISNAIDIKIDDISISISGQCCSSTMRGVSTLSSQSATSSMRSTVTFSKNGFLVLYFYFVHFWAKTFQFEYFVYFQSNIFLIAHFVHFQGKTEETEAAQVAFLASMRRTTKHL